jgi:hypothetical protein
VSTDAGAGATEGMEQFRGGTGVCVREQKHEYVRIIYVHVCVCVHHVYVWMYQCDQ